MRLPDGTVTGNLIWIILGLVLVIKIIVEMWMARRKKDQQSEREQTISRIVQETTESVLRRILEDPPKNSVLLTIEKKLTHQINEELISRLLRDRPASQAFLDFQTTQPGLIKDMIREVVPMIVKEVLPGVLREAIPCFRKDQTCGEAVRALYNDQIRDTFRESHRLMIDNNVRLKDLQKRIANGGMRDRPTMPGIETKR